MLSLGFGRRRMLSWMVVTVVFVLAAFIITKEIINNVSAIDYTMPAGFNDQVFYNCVVGQFKKDFKNEVVPDDGLTDSQLAMMKRLTCNGNGTTKFSDVSGLEKMTGLTSLDLQWNEISSIDIANNIDLTYLDLKNNNITSLDISNNTKLETIDVSSNNISVFSNVSHRDKLKFLYISNNDLTTLDVSDDSALKELVVYDNQDLNSLVVTGDISLMTIEAANCRLNALDISTNTSLTSLNINSNVFTTLSLPSTDLEELRAQSNGLTSLDISNATKLKRLYITFNLLSSIDFSGNLDIEDIQMGENCLDSINVYKNTSLTVLKAPEQQKTDKMCAQHNGGLSSLVLPSTTTLRELDVRVNKISSVDVSNYTELVTLVIDNNSISSLDVSNNAKLNRLEVYNNQLTAIDISNNPLLKTFTADNIPVKSIVGVASYGSTTALSFSNMGYLKSFQNITTTGDYSYNKTDKVLTVADESNILSSVPITSTLPGYSYSIELPIFLAFDANGGSGAPGAIVCYPESGLDSCSYVIPADEPTREGYGFLGWANSATATTADYKAGDTVTKSGYAAIYAVWSPIHLLTFYLNGGTSDIAKQTCYSNTNTTGYCDVTIPTNEVTRDGYVFMGWSRSVVANLADYLPGSTVSMDSDVDLYAVWSRIQTLSFNLNGGTSDIADQTCHSLNNVTNPCNITIPTNAVTRDGYVFLGWANSATANTKDYVSGGTISMSSDKTVYAVWSPIYTLSFNLNGGTSDITSQTCYPEIVTTNPCNVTIPTNAVTKEDSTFFGFATTATARNPEYVSGDTYTFVGGGSRNATLYAVFGNSDTDWIDGQEYVKGVDDGIDITVNYPLSILERVLIDGVEVPENQYTVDETTGEVFIKGTYLDTLSAGEHTLSLVFSDGNVIELSFRIVLNHTTNPEDNEATAGLEPSDSGEIILNLTTPKVPVASVTIDIYDDQGILVKTIEISDPVNPTRIDVSDLAAGDYVAEITHKDIDGNILLVTREEFTVNSGDTVALLPIQTEVDVTEWIVIEVYDEDGDLVRVVKVEVETGAVYVYDKDGELINTIENGYENGRIVLPMDGLPSANYDLDIYFLTKELREVGTLNVDDARYAAQEIPVPDTGMFKKEGDGVTNTVSIILPAVSAIVLIAYILKRQNGKKVKFTLR